MLIKTGIIEQYGRAFVRRKIVTIALAIIGATLSTVVLLTYYGTQVGNFVITVEGRKYQSLSLSDKEDRSIPTSRLLAKSMRECLDADYSMIPQDIDEGMGNKNDTVNLRYLAYTFYLINSGDIALNYTMSYNIVRSEKQLESIIRIMVIKDGERTVYAKAREDSGHFGEPEGVFIDENGRDPEATPLFYTVPFQEDATNTVIKETIYDFPAGSYSKYTVVMWLDGWDLQETNYMMSAAIQTEIVFNIIS